MSGVYYTIIPHTPRISAIRAKRGAARRPAPRGGRWVMARCSPAARSRVRVHSRTRTRRGHGNVRHIRPGVVCAELPTRLDIRHAMMVRPTARLKLPRPASRSRARSACRTSPPQTPHSRATRSCPRRSHQRPALPPAPSSDRLVVRGCCRRTPWP